MKSYKHVEAFHLLNMLRSFLSWTRHSSKWSLDVCKLALETPIEILTVLVNKPTGAWELESAVVVPRLPSPQSLTFFQHQKPKEILRIRWLQQSGDQGWWSGDASFFQLSQQYFTQNLIAPYDLRTKYWASDRGYWWKKIQSFINGERRKVFSRFQHIPGW